MTTALLDTLTDEQLAAVTATGDIVHVSAPAGSGKTRTIVSRLAWLIDQGVSPEEICCLTFTRAAAAEIRDRVEAAAGPVAERAVIATFHEAALELGPGLGGLQIATESEVEAAIDSLYKGPQRRPRGDVPGKKTLEVAIAAFEAGVIMPHAETVRLVLRRLRDAGLVPLWDLIPKMRGHQRSAMAREFEHVLVDEQQDVTQSEMYMARTLTEPFGGQLYLVGDERQAIFGWRFGGPDYAAGPAEITRTLTKTFRFGQAIADESNALEVGPPITGNPDVESVVERQHIDEMITDALVFPDELETAVLVRTRADAWAVNEMFPASTRFVTRNPLDPMSSPADRIRETLDEGLVPILTVHGAKGREFDRVIVIGPSTMAWGLASDDPEECRVLYVAMTRARKELVLATGRPGPEWGQWRARACGISGGNT